MAKTSPTARSLAELKKLGFYAQVVEKWNPFARVRQDLFGVIDIVVICPNGILGIQATSGPNHSARREKALAEPRLLKWLEAGGSFEVWSWAKQGPRGGKKVWTLRREAINRDDFYASDDDEEKSAESFPPVA